MINWKKYSWYTFLFLVTVLIIVGRRPDAFQNPQFFAEDGVYWFAESYQFGFFKPLYTHTAGYLQTFSRLTASIALLFPLYRSPFIYNLAALIAHILPILYLMSGRFKKYHIVQRFIVVVGYLLLTNTGETYLNLTNAQWYLALSLFLVVVAEPTASVWWKILDFLVLLIGGLSGPFSLFLLFPTFYLVYKKQLVMSSLPVQLTCLTAGIQALTLFLDAASAGERLAQEISFTLYDVYAIFYRQILWGLIAGPSGYNTILRYVPFSGIFFLVSSLMSLVVIGYAIWKANPPVKAFMMFSLITFLSALVSPSVASDSQRTAYQVMFATPGIRYWLIPMICMLVLFVWGVAQRNTIVRRTSLLFLFVLFIFDVKYLVRFHQLKYPAYVDYHWQEHVEAFEQIPVGDQFSFQINPGWEMIITKKQEQTRIFTF